MSKTIYLTTKTSAEKEVTGTLNLVPYRSISSKNDGIEFMQRWEILNIRNLGIIGLIPNKDEAYAQIEVSVGKFPTHLPMSILKELEEGDTIVCIREEDGTKLTLMVDQLGSRYSKSYDEVLRMVE